MGLETWYKRFLALDIRVWAAIGATFLLIAGVMWVVPTTPSSNSFTFDSTRRGMSDARPIEDGEPIQGMIVDGSDADFYRIAPMKAAYFVDVRLINHSQTMIPGLRIFDTRRNLLQDKTVQNIRNVGGSIECSFLAQSNMNYYIQVLSQRNTTGPYTIAFTVRKP